MAACGVFLGDPKLAATRTVFIGDVGAGKPGSGAPGAAFSKAAAEGTPLLTTLRHSAVRIELHASLADDPRGLAVREDGGAFAYNCPQASQGPLQTRADPDSAAFAKALVADAGLPLPPLPEPLSPMITVGQPWTTIPPWEVMSVSRTAAMLLMSTVGEPLLSVSVGPTHMDWSLTIAAGRFPIRTVAADPRQMPPTWGTTAVTRGHTWLSVMRAANFGDPATASIA